MFNINIISNPMTIHNDFSNIGYIEVVARYTARFISIRLFYVGGEPTSPGVLNGLASNIVNTRLEATGRCSKPNVRKQPARTAVMDGRDVTKDASGCIFSYIHTYT